MIFFQSVFCSRFLPGGCLFHSLFCLRCTVCGLCCLHRSSLLRNLLEPGCTVCGLCCLRRSGLFRKLLEPDCAVCGLCCPRRSGLFRKLLEPGCAVCGLFCLHRSGFLYSRLSLHSLRRKLSGLCCRRDIHRGCLSGSSRSLSSKFSGCEVSCEVFSEVFFPARSSVICIRLPIAGRAGLPFCPFLRHVQRGIIPGCIGHMFSHLPFISSFLSGMGVFRHAPADSVKHGWLFGVTPDSRAGVSVRIHRSFLSGSSCLSFVRCGCLFTFCGGRLPSFQGCFLSFSGSLCFFSLLSGQRGPDCPALAVRSSFLSRPGIV